MTTNDAHDLCLHCGESASEIAALRRRVATLEKAADEARYWIVKSGAAHPGGIVALLQAAIHPPSPPAEERETP